LVDDWCAAFIGLAKVCTQWRRRETNRSEEIKKLTSQGVLPVGMETEHRPHLAGQISGSIKVRPRPDFGDWHSDTASQSVEPAGVIVERMVKETIESLQRGTQMLQARL
jgi:hypothetical protein